MSRTGSVGRRRSAGAAFVGRERELSSLSAAAAAARRGRAGAVLVVGEAGIGKTRLVEEALRRGHVFWGRCADDAAAPAYWPWTQVVRAARDAGLAPSDDVVPLLDGGAVPAGGDRFRLFDAVGRWLAELGAMTVVLDDLHWADEASVRLFAFLARTRPARRLLLVGIQRDDETPAIAEPLAALARVSERVALRGLGPAHTADLVRRVAGAAVVPAVADGIHRRTGGNPFFVDAIARQLAADETAQDVPAVVRDAVRQRLARLPSGVRALLETAAVAGERFRPDALPDADVALLEDARRAGLLRGPDAADGSWRFTHAILRETLQADLPDAHRRQLHAELADALACRADRREAVAIAHHRLLADDADPAALDAAVGAAQAAVARGEHEQAAKLLDRVLASRAATGFDDVRRCDLLLMAGRARAGVEQPTRSEGHFLAAADVARRLGDPARLAQAALGYAGRWIALGRRDERAVALLDEALVAVGDGPASLRAALLAHLAVASWEDTARRAALADDAVETARCADDARTLGTALYVRHFVLVDWARAGERLAAAEEIVRLGEQAGAQELVARGLACLVEAHRERGDPTAAAPVRAAAGAIGERLRTPGATWASGVWRLLDALTAGRFRDADRLVAETAALGERFDIHETGPVTTLATFALRREQGRLAEVAPAIDALTLPLVPYLRVVLLAETGHLHDARATFALVAARDFADLPLDVSALMALSLAADGCALLGDVARAALLLPRLERLVASGIATSSGPTTLRDGFARHAGMLASLLGRCADAERHFVAAAALDERLGSRPGGALTQHATALMLLARDAPHDRARAATLIAAASATARALGMRALAARLAPLEVATPSGALPTVEASDVSFRRDGEHWVVAYGDRTLRLRDARGLRVIARLVAEPHREFHALDLEAALDGSAQLPVRAGSGGTRIDVLQPAARAACGARLDDLRAEIAEAEAVNDHDRAARARALVEQVGAEMARAAGLLRPRGRRATPDAERARLNVTRAIGAAIRRIGASLPEVGWLLARAIRTGTYCSYVPPPVAGRTRSSVRSTSA